MEREGEGHVYRSWRPGGGVGVGVGAGGAIYKRIRLLPEVDRRAG